ncbi:unnamed protein product [Acanthoscelides obtectus]|uniref:Uncharacterized protein n=2 Tax=Acanthoscelides obtectus TaxID=200917 RepID=A0A9P0MH66_ACAOB|nr:unnamed protein product [Acanthoscelides obtectus]CAK1653396.1 hypothetical protein AOBTE_LOCUS18210 [Acanthoscelides obtectus]
MLLWEESTELDLLRTLVKELQSKNRIAEENSQLLREKVHFLEDRVDYLNKKVQQHENTKHPSDSVTSNEEPRKIHNVVANNEIVILENLSAEPVDDSFALPAANSPVIVNSAPIATRTEKDEDKWIEVRNRNTNKISVRNRPVDKSSRPEPLRGSNVNICSLRPASRVSSLFLSGLAPEVTSESVKNFLKENNFNEYTCEKMKTKKGKYCSSFRLTVPHDDIDKYLCPDLWPRGILINHFRNLQRQNMVKENLNSRKSSSGNFDTFLESMEGILTQLSRNRQIILAGDFNVI